MERNGAEMVHDMAQGRQDTFFDNEAWEPSILDFSMFSVYIGDLIKEIKTGKIWIVDEIGKNYIIGKIGETTKYMSRSEFLWAATPSMPVGKGWK